MKKVLYDRLKPLENKLYTANHKTNPYVRRMSDAELKWFYDVYNELFDMKESPSRCIACLIQHLRDVAVLYFAHKEDGQTEVAEAVVDVVEEVVVVPKKKRGRKPKIQ